MSTQLELFQSTAKPQKFSRCARYEVQLVRNGSVPYTLEKINSTQVACRVIPQIVRPVLEHSPHEKLVVVCVDTKLVPIGFSVVTEGTLDASLVHPREVFRTAIAMNASSIFLVHNHPSGDCTPSRQDREVTERIRKAGEIIGISLMDHIVVGHDNGEYKAVSLSEC